MNRIALTDGTGCWFDADKAEKFSEGTYWNGNNHISKATGSQWEHEFIYVTASGRFILLHSSAYQGGRDSVEEITKNEAARWFAKQEFSNDQIPAALSEGVNDLEIL